MSPEDRAAFEDRLERAKAVLRQMGDAAKPTSRERTRLLGKATGVALALSYLREYPGQPPADHGDGSAAGGREGGEGA